MAQLIGLGLDLVAVERMRTTLARTPGFARRVFTEAEIAAASMRGDPAASYAARFAAKEATLKALGLGLWDVSLVDIEVVGGGSGPPTLELHRAALLAADERGVTGWMLSLSHDGGVAAAVVAALH